MPFGAPRPRTNELFHAQKVARPEGTERTPPTIVIEGVEEMVERLLAA
jgi:hypothetical protein